MRNHRWSGWPGAFCLDCGQQDQLEIYLGDGLYDPITGEWADETVREAYASSLACPGPPHVLSISGGGIPLPVDGHDVSLDEEGVTVKLKK